MTKKELVERLSSLSDNNEIKIVVQELIPVGNSIKVSEREVDIEHIRIDDTKSSIVVS